jgi:hypothetical protein
LEEEEIILGAQSLARLLRVLACVVLLAVAALAYWMMGY